MKVSVLKKLLWVVRHIDVYFLSGFPTTSEHSRRDITAPISQTSKPKHGDAKDKSNVTQQMLAGFG